MKKITAVILTLCMMLIMWSNVSASVNAAEYETISSVIDIPVGEHRNIRFTASAEGTVSLMRSDNKVGTMNDLGIGADKKGGDGIKSVGLDLYSDTRRTETYYAYADGKTVAEYTVNYYAELTPYDFEIKEAVNLGVLQIESENPDKSFAELSDMVYDYLYANPYVVDIGRTETSITYTTDAGITSVYTHFEDGYKGAGGTLVNTETGETQNSDVTLSWTNPDIAVFRPFRNSISDNGAGFAIDDYLAAANSIKAVTGGQIFVYDDGEGNPYNLAYIMDKVGFLYIDSHGVDVQVDGRMMSSIILENTNNDGISDADWQAGRVLDIYNEGLVAVTGDYIKAHYEQEGRRLENTIIHLGICLGMKYDSLYVPFSELGASYIEGYTETVSTWYDANCVKLISGMVSKQKPDADRSYTFTEAIAEAKKQFGEVDPGGWGAVIQTYGNENMTCIVPETGVDSVELSDFDVTVNNYAIAPLTVAKDGKPAYAYKQEWKSSDESVVKIAANRTVTGVKEGRATLTCTITSGDTVIEKSCEVTVTYIKAESVKLLIRQTSFGVGSVAVVRSVIYPRTTSEKIRTLYTTNPGSVEISGDKIYTKRPGYAHIAVVTESGLTEAKRVSVTNKAACVQSTPEDGRTYAIYSTDNVSYSVIMNNKKSGSYLKWNDVTNSNGYITSSVASPALWKVEGASDGFYIRNDESGQYLTLTDSGIALTGNAQSAFALDGNRLHVVNTEESNSYLKFKSDKGFSFSTKAQGSKIYFMEKMNYSDDEQFATVTFDLGGNSFAEQRVQKGKSAIAASPLPADGRIFKGFDIPMCNITGDVTAKALWKDGTMDTDKVLVTFMHTDGTVIEEKEYAKNAHVTAPTVPDEKDGKPFAYWSEKLDKADHNMTVFAIYEQQYVLGDVNSDGKINTADATVVLKVSAGIITLNATQEKSANVNHDDKVNTADAVLILKYAAEMISAF